jgi:hypothetical protein
VRDGIALLFLIVIIMGECLFAMGDCEMFNDLNLA